MDREPKVLDAPHAEKIKDLPTEGSKRLRRASLFNLCGGRSTDIKTAWKTHKPTLSDVPGCGRQPPPTKPAINKAAIVGPMSDGFAAIPYQVMRPVQPAESVRASTASISTASSGSEDVPDTVLGLKARLASVTAQCDALARELTDAEAELEKTRKWYTAELRESNAVKHDYRRRVQLLEDREQMLLTRIAELELGRRRQ
jgi:hypothetical protein